jgi:hypothetical protein
VCGLRFRSVARWSPNSSMAFSIDLPYISRQ